jgi:uncharacterized protein (DUF4415 family)
MTERRDGMANRRPLTNDEGEVRELTEEDFAAAKKFSDLPEEEQRVLKGIMEENAARKKVAVPLSPAVVEKMRSTGEGWEARVEEAVVEWLERREKTAS